MSVAPNLAETEEKHATSGFLVNKRGKEKRDWHPVHACLVLSCDKARIGCLINCNADRKAKRNVLREKG